MLAGGSQIISFKQPSYSLIIIELGKFLSLLDAIGFSVYEFALEGKCDVGEELPGVEALAGLHEGVEDELVERALEGVEAQVLHLDALVEDLPEIERFLCHLAHVAVRYHVPSRHRHCQALPPTALASSLSLTRPT